ncbi:MAG TPA: methyltransferase [Tepidisphaeraceae bacterium]|nr:methyltransferase [Tepidisphaeraceae bacterium]
MPDSQIHCPRTDPAAIFELYRGSYTTALLTAAVAEFRVFDRLARGAKTEQQLIEELGLSARAGNVLLVALRAMGLLEVDESGRLIPTDIAREHLIHGGEFDVSDYVSQTGGTELVREMVERLRTNRPAGAKPDEQGVAFIYKQGMTSAMEQEAAARKHTLALAGRAKNVAPILAQRVPMGGANVLLDVAGGTGIYSIACLKRYPKLRAIIWDRPQVLKVAKEFAEADGVADRIQFLACDMFADAVPEGCDLMLLSNVLHDWDIPECKMLINRLTAALPDQGRLLIHDVYLNDAMNGPLSVAMYSANLFCLTEGRAYSAAEYRSWLKEAALQSAEVIPTLAHCGVLPATKSEAP